MVDFFSQISYHNTNRTPRTSHASDVSHGETFCIMEAYYGKTNYERSLFSASEGRKSNGSRPADCDRTKIGILVDS